MRFIKYMIMHYESSNFAVKFESYCPPTERKLGLAMNKPLYSNLCANISHHQLTTQLTP